MKKLSFILDYSRDASPTNYEYYGFHNFSPDLNYSTMEELRPVKENILWSNFVYNPTYAGSTGAGYTFDGTSGALVRTLESPLYDYAGTGTESNLPIAQVNSNATWIYYADIDPTDDGDLLSFSVGITTNSSRKFLLSSGIKNCYGLNESSARIDVGSTVLSPGVASSVTAGGLVTCYPQNDVPSLATTNYYFASQTWYFNYNNTGWPGYGALPGSPPPLPGSPTFSINSTSAPIIVGIGQPITVSGWAKMAIGNGYSNHFAYLEQYFDKAYTMDTNGVATTNSAGVLSPYGEFFPTQPGPVALFTKTDIDTGVYGSVVVSVLKLQLDVNHDGVMDLSYGGPDNTSANRPFVFWVNDDYDRYSNVGGGVDDDDLASNDRAANSPYTGSPTPDCEYRDESGHRVIPNPRDLEDYARLWISGADGYFFANLPPGTTGVLSWGDTDSPNTNNPTIDLFGAADIDGGIGYLTVEATATSQTAGAGAGWAVGRLGPGQSFMVFSNGFSFSSFPYLIWCGVKPGSGTLTLTIAQGTNKPIATTSAYIQIKNIKEMYERYTVGDKPRVAPTAVPKLAEDGVTTPFHYPPPTDTSTPYILLVHDYNLPAWKEDRYAETAFKRLYWRLSRPFWLVSMAPASTVGILPANFYEQQRV